MKINTLGFTRKSAEKFFNLLSSSGTKVLIDVRLNNISQLAGFAKKEDLKFFLRKICGIDYLHFPELAPKKEALKAYQDKKMSWQDYENEFMSLMASRSVERSLDKGLINDACLLCSEDKPHQCHRRLVAEYLRTSWSDQNVEIRHLT
ncbi:DUF488 domain-containing protein [Xanthomonas campestris pv. raphani]|uniref:DUF488 domain-containing protein n=1 Tax=Xanthomonas campestris TaxID=339 RepID=UPI002358CB0D|nr:DUF488 domain-containing protein [Xanthomonas campestris]MDC8748107.1 DUF488 domain-containing protein [Xanthomonas campestris]MEA9886926.1 DUF488 domain-containing protein [Xanthomonas campestris pv. raphani]